MEINHSHIKLAHILYQSETCPYRKMKRMTDLLATIIKTLGLFLISSRPDILKDSKVFSESNQPLSLGHWQALIQVYYRVLKHDHENFLSNRYIYDLKELLKILEGQKIIAFRNYFMHRPLADRSVIEENLKNMDRILNILIESSFFSLICIRNENGEELTHEQSEQFLRQLLNTDMRITMEPDHWTKTNYYFYYMDSKGHIPIFLPLMKHKDEMRK